MKRLVYAFDSALEARRAVDLLLHDGITENHLAVLARGDIPLDEIERYREVSQDVEPAMVRGLVSGGVIGLAAGGVALLFPSLGINLGAMDLLWTTLGGAMIGAWSSALIGASVPNKVERTFEQEFVKGNVLVRVDAKKEEVDHISAILGDAFPQHLLFQSDFSRLRPRY
jgi:hypothetical protein